MNLVEYSDDEAQTTPQQSQTSHPLSEDLHTAADLDSESDAKSEPVRSTRKKKNVKEGRSKQTSETIPHGADITKASKENRGKAIEVSSGESEEEDDSENTDSEEAEEVDAENVEPPVSVNEKEKKRKAPLLGSKTVTTKLTFKTSEEENENFLRQILFRNRFFLTKSFAEEKRGIRQELEKGRYATTERVFRSVAT